MISREYFTCVINMTMISTVLRANTPVRPLSINVLKETKKMSQITKNEGSKNRRRKEAAGH